MQVLFRFANTEKMNIIAVLTSKQYREAKGELELLENNGRDTYLLPLPLELQELFTARYTLIMVSSS